MRNLIRHSILVSTLLIGASAAHAQGPGTPLTPEARARRWAIEHELDSIADVRELGAGDSCVFTLSHDPSRPSRAT